MEHLTLSYHYVCFWSHYLNKILNSLVPGLISELSKLYFEIIRVIRPELKKTKARRKVCTKNVKGTFQENTKDIEIVNNLRTYVKKGKAMIIEIKGKSYVWKYFCEISGKDQILKCGFC